MDPQLRLLMELVYEAIENASIPAESLSGSNTSVFSGTFARDYFDTTIADSELLSSSFFMDNGASLTIDTGCSTSMAALHQAVRNVQLRESDLSIVASASVLLNPDMFIVMSSQNVLSAEGRCFAWDERATDYGRGEGVAAVILKLLDDALRDGDHIHAVIRESGLNQDGKTTTISSPSMEAQQKLIEKCYRHAGLRFG
ncbi:thiolase-like protein [Aspergillus recurvatus]